MFIYIGSFIPKLCSSTEDYFLDDDYGKWIKRQNKGKKHWTKLRVHSFFCAAGVKMMASDDLPSLKLNMKKMHWSESPADSPAYNICFGTYSSYIERWLKLNSLQDLLDQQPFKTDPPIGAIAEDGDVKFFPGQSNLDRAGSEAVTLALLAEL